MGFNYYFKRSIGVNNAYSGAIRVNKRGINQRFYIIQPYFLSAAFKANAGVDVFR